MTRRPLFWLQFGCVGLVVALVAEPASAQEDPRPRAAKAACSSGLVQQGITLLGELYAETNDPSWVYNQARCYQQNGQREPALSRFHEFLRVAGPTQAQARAEAERHIKQLEDEGRPKTDPTVPPPAPPPVAPVPQGALQTTAALAPSKTSDGYRNRLYLGSAALAAVSVVALTTAVVTGAKVRSLDKEVEAWNGMPGVVVDNSAYESRKDRASRYATGQWLSYAIAGLSAAGGGFCFYLARRGSRADEVAAAARKVTLVPTINGGARGGALSLSF